MPLAFEQKGNAHSPLLVAIHGLMGRPEEFQFLDKVKNDFNILMPDLHTQTHARTFIDSAENLDSFDYDMVSHQIAELLQKEFGGQGAYFLGHSSGGKIVFDFMAKYPDLFLGSVNTDISPAPFDQASFYQLFMKVVPALDLSLPWPKIKENIKALIPDRHAQILVSSQIYYPTPGASAQWRDGVDLLDKKLSKQKISHQMPEFEKICEDHRHKKNIILVAEHLSSIPPEVLKKLEDSEAFETLKVPGSSHFIHISHHEEICKSLITMKEWKIT